MTFDDRISPEECSRLRALSRFEAALWKRGIGPVAGVDEAGRGPLAGPVVAAAVILAPGTLIAGIDDSKCISEPKREMLFPVIVERAVSIGIGIVEHGDIDRLNILDATHEAMRRAIACLNPRPGFTLIDGNSFHDETMRYRNIVKGDGRSISIGAASILAKVTRDRLMRLYHEQYPQYGFDRHKGYGTSSHIEAIRLYGPCPIHRKTFHIKGMQSDG
jgi:ribonuclease HII